MLAVIAFHEQFTAAPGGFLGVDVFFVLSGYLITDLLVVHRKRRGRLDLRGFWVRRARRLLPALAVVLVTVTAAAAVFEPDQLGQLRPALLAAVTYSSNWWQALHHQSYFTTFGPPPLLRHLWSLAIEEQFYMAWPLILAIVLAVSRRKRVRVAIAWLGAAASALLVAVIYVPGTDPSRVYYGTDTRATSLLIGAALALTWPLSQLTAASKERTQRLDLAGMIGIAVLAWAIGHFSDSDAALYPAGLVVAALAAGAVVMAAAGPRDGRSDPARGGVLALDRDADPARRFPRHAPRPLPETGRIPRRGPPLAAARPPGARACRRAHRRLYRGIPGPERSGVHGCTATGREWCEVQPDHAHTRRGNGRLAGNHDGGLSG